MAGDRNGMALLDDERVRAIRKRAGDVALTLRPECIPEPLLDLVEEAQLLGTGDDGVMLLIADSLPEKYVRDLNSRLSAVDGVLDAYLSSDSAESRREWVAFCGLRRLADSAAQRFAQRTAATAPESWDPNLFGEILENVFGSKVPAVRAPEYFFARVPREIAAAVCDVRDREGDPVFALEPQELPGRLRSLLFELELFGACDLRVCEVIRSMLPEEYMANMRDRLQAMAADVRSFTRGANGFRERSALLGLCAVVGAEV